MDRHPGGVLKSDSAARSFCCVCKMLLLALLLSLLAVGLAEAATYYVDAARPDDMGDGLSWDGAKKTIQAVIGASTAGDTILVKYGGYFITNSVLIDSTRVLTSDDGTHNSWDSADPDSSLCVVSASGTSRVFTINGAGVTSATRVRGFKVTGGDAKSEGVGPWYGGGIYVGGGADPVVENCWITNNRGSTNSNGNGGGVACMDAGTGAVIRYCRIDNNVASTSGTTGEGGGLYFKNTALCQVYENEILSNIGSTARIGNGGGICESNAILQIWSNTISYNVGTNSGAAGGVGGGISTYIGNVEIWDNVITYNHAAEGSTRNGSGGGIGHTGGGVGTSIIIRDNRAISYNTGSTGGNGYGGGIYAGASYLEIYGNTIEGNIASSSAYASASYRNGYGGGIYLGSNSILVRGNRILSNTASLSGSGYGGGLNYSYGETVERNIVAFNVASASATVTDVGQGGGSWFAWGWSTGATNNTFYRNANVIYAGVSGAGSGLYYGGSDVPAFKNNIIADNDVTGSDGIGFYSATAFTMSYNCFHNNPGGNYTTNVTSTNEELGDPMLGDPAGGDFSLMYNSSCIEEGDPTYAVPANGGWVVDIGAIEYTGTRHWRPVAGTGLLLFGGQVKAKVNVTALGDLSEIDMIVHPGETHPAAPTGVARWYDIDHVGTGMEFALTLSYLHGELNGQVEDSLCAWRWTGSAWEGPKVPSARDLTQNWLTVSGQASFSGWTLGGGGMNAGVGERPEPISLFAAHPNPFSPATTISYRIVSEASIRVEVHDVAGRLVKVLVDSHHGPGDYHVVWDGTDQGGQHVASGVYFCRLAAGGTEQFRKITLVR